MRINNFNNLTINNLSINKKPKSTPLNFKGFNCSEEDFEIKKLYNIPCPICGINMVTSKQIFSFSNEIQNKKGQELIKALRRYEKYYHLRERRIIGTIEYRANINPEKTLSELVSEQYIEQLPKIRKAQRRALKELKTFFKQDKRINFKQAEEIIRKYNNILDENNESYFDEKKLFQELRVLLEAKLINQKNLRNIILSFPDINKEFSFFAKFNNSSDSKIAMALLKQSVSSCEHVVPKSKNGKNNTDNYLAQCRECNSLRNDNDFSYWIDSKYNFKNNFINYLNRIAQCLRLGELNNEYDSYLNDIVETVYKETQGTINVKAPSIERVVEEKEKRTAKIEEIIKRLNRKKEQLKELKELGASELIVEYESLFKEKKRTESSLRKIQESYKKKILNIKKYKAKEKTFQLKLSELRQDNNSKNQKQLRSKIAKLKTYLEETDCSVLEEELFRIEERIKELIKRKETIESRIKFLESQINFSKKIKAKIAFITIKEDIAVLEQEILKADLAIEKYNQGLITFNVLINLISKI